jgi:hypothetical protein
MQCVVHASAPMSPEFQFDRWRLTLCMEQALQQRATPTTFLRRLAQ